METMSLRKANAKRKNIDKEIANILNDKSNYFINLYTSKKKFVGILTPEKASERITSLYQSLTDMIAYREKLNVAVLKANANTMVKVPKFINLETVDLDDTEEISIAAAINRKKYYEDFLKSYYLRIIKDNLNTTINRFNDISKAMEELYQRDITNQFGIGSSQSAKARLEYAESIKHNYEAVLIDPLNLQDKIDKISQMINSYIVEVDSIISNACENTMVTIE